MNEARDALCDLVGAVRQLAGLTEQVGPFSLPAGTDANAPALLEAVCGALRVPLRFDGPSPGVARDYAPAVLAAEIHRAQAVQALATLDDVDAVAESARQIADEQDAGLRSIIVDRSGAPVITAVEAGPPDGPRVLVSPPCAMSPLLSLRWVRKLAALGYRCLVPATRGTTGRIVEATDFDRHGSGVEDQVDDLAAAAATLGGSRIHLMGLCGGATAALALAARRPDLVESLSLWHAAAQLGPEVPESAHQANLRTTLDIAAESRDTTAWLRRRLVAGPMTGVPPGIGPLVVRPYATDELLYRYAKLMVATMHEDSRAAVSAIRQPCLLVTSEADSTAHPAGSRWIAAELPGAQLALTGHVDHLDAFRATDSQLSMLTGFLGGSA
ncbi:alpha/beta fold hydrolase [Pseudonocardia sp. ICBG1142]|uniref:alpha/beta fold hydrolase n=1 Tax=Pseudonocardia sp. ICBG1142 TaxID=2846760 RepID=UPI001CF65AEF|nr:alpha/beta hydrolase [Pseudonocardia sp. ICBG1142]